MSPRRLRILYLTDDRSNYRQGYYYVDWMDVIAAHHDVTFFGPGSGTGRVRAEDFDLLVYGHGAFDVSRLMPPRGRRARWLPWTVEEDGFPGINLARVRVPKIMFTKNDYKEVAEKAAFYKRYGFSILVSFTSLAQGWTKEYGIDAHWLPFGVNDTVFRDLAQERPVAIGFRGNAHAEYIGPLRRELADAILRLPPAVTRDVELSELGEGFLFGDAYVSWLNRCALVANTKSALDIVNPKFLESMACGAVPLAPVDRYEGLLEADVHYLAVSPGFADLPAKVARFFGDAEFRARLRASAAAFAAANTMECRYRQLWSLLDERRLLPRR